MPNQILIAVQQNDQNGNVVSYTFDFQFDDGNGNIGGTSVQIQASSLDTPSDITAAQNAATTQAGSLYQSWLNNLYSGTVSLSQSVGPVTFANIVKPPALITAIASKLASL